MRNRGRGEGERERGRELRGQRQGRETKGQGKGISMRQQSKGIVLSCMPYQEHAIIVRIYTAYFGLHAYLVRGVRRPKASRFSIGYFQSLNLLDLAVSHRPTRELQQLTDVGFSYVYRCLPFDPEKQVYVTLFCSLLGRVLVPLDEKNDEEAVPCFSFIYDSCLAFDALDNRLAASFALQFIAKLSFYVGIAIKEDSLYKQATTLGYSSVEAHSLCYLCFAALKSPYGAFSYETTEKTEAAATTLQGQRALDLLLSHYEVYLGIRKLKDYLAPQLFLAPPASAEKPSL